MDLVEEGHGVDFSPGGGLAGLEVRVFGCAVGDEDEAAAGLDIMLLARLVFIGVVLLCVRGGERSTLCQIRAKGELRRWGLVRM